MHRMKHQPIIHPEYLVNAPNYRRDSLGCVDLENLDKSVSDFNRRSIQGGSNSILLPANIKPNNMGFIDVIAGVTQLVASGATAGISVYGTIEATKLAEERQELDEEVALRKLAMQEQINNANLRILEIQASGQQASQDITIDLQRAEADLRKAQIDRLSYLEQAQKKLTSLEQQELELIQSEKNELVKSSGLQPESLKQEKDTLVKYFGMATFLLAVVLITRRKQ